MYRMSVSKIYNCDGEKPVIASVKATEYAIHSGDVVESIHQALTGGQGPTGLCNVCDNDNLPYNNREVFDAICDELGMDRLECINQIKAPNRKISAQKFHDTGYQVHHADPNAVVVVCAQAKAQINVRVAGGIE